MADNGRYGPYVRRGSDYRSLENEEQLFTVTLENALALLSQPRARRASQAAQPPAGRARPRPGKRCPGRRQGRPLWPYVTDGTVNASLRRGDSVETLTIERAAELLAERRLRAEADGSSGAGARGRGRRRSGTTAKRASGTKKASAKKITAKKGLPRRLPPRRLPPRRLAPRNCGEKDHRQKSHCEKVPSEKGPSQEDLGDKLAGYGPYRTSEPLSHSATEP